MTDHREPVCICEPETEWEGDLLVQKLNGEGISAFLANRSSTSLWGDGALPFAKLEILVPAVDAERAKEIVDAENSFD